MNATEVLDAYLDADHLAVPHAILIEGRWGSGKTYFLEKVYEPERRKKLRGTRRDHTPFLFVSLFGVTSATDVEMRIYKTANPGEAIAGSIAGTLAFGIGEFFRVKDTTKGVVDRLGKKAIKRLNDYVFVFDDLERLEQSAFGEVMGLINSLVSEHNRKVILVADEIRLQERAPEKIWAEQQEKIIGRRVHISPDLEGVMRAAIERLPDGASKAKIKSLFVELHEVALKSGVENLRSVIWALHAVNSFVECVIGDSDISPTPHVARLANVVFATTLWIRSGKLSINALSRIPDLSTALALRSASRSQPDEPLDSQLQQVKSFVDTFINYDVDTAPIDYKFIADFENSGIVNASEVIHWIKTNYGIGKDFSEPYWRQVWHAYERSTADTEKAIVNLRDEVQRRVHNKAGVILHVVGLAIRQWKANDRRLTNNDDVVSYFKQYIDEIAERKMLNVEESDDHSFPSESYGGLGFTSSNTAGFKEIRKYIRTKLSELKIATIQSRASDLIDEAELVDPRALLQYTNSGDYEFVNNPVLSNVAEDRIVSIITKDFPSLNCGAKLLAYRYRLVSIDHPLYRELDWARTVYIRTMEKLEGWNDPYKTLAQKYLVNMITHYEGKKRPDYRIITGENTSQQTDSAADSADEGAKANAE